MGSFRIFLENDFASWFSGSKVVDSKGNPLRVFHGTPETGFSKLEPGHGRNTGHEIGGLGLWFTSDPAVASDFAIQKGTMYFHKKEGDKPAKDVEFRDNGTWSPRKINDAEPGRDQYFRDYERVGSVFPVYLKIVNPKIYGTGNEDGFEELMNDRDEFAIYINGTKGQKGFWRHKYVNENPKEATKQFRDSLMAKGHDGIIIKNSKWDAVDKKPHDQYVVFNSDQIRQGFKN